MSVPATPDRSPRYQATGAVLARRLAPPILLLAALLQFCLFLNRAHVTTAHEGRVMVSAREMIASGDWIVPHSNGLPRLQKPPLPYWSAVTLWTIAGRAEPWLARLPPALCGAISVLLVMSLARQTLGRDAAVLAGLVWISTWFIVDEHRKAMSDPYLAFFTLLAVWSWITAHRRTHHTNPRAHVRASARAGADTITRTHPSTPGQSAAPPRMLLPPALLTLAYLSTALGALSKGPLIFLHVALALVPYHLVTRTRPRGATAHLVGIIFLLAVALPWPLAVARRVPDALSVWRNEIEADRATSGAKSAPPWHYAAALPLTAAPWTVFGAIGLLLPFISKRRRDRRHLWPLLWLGATVVVFTFVPMKKNAYLLPAMPAQTLVVAAALASMLTRVDAGKRLNVAAHATAAGAAVCVTLFLVLRLPTLSLDPPGPLLAASGVAIFLLIVTRALATSLTSLRTLALIAAGFALAVHGVVAWLKPQRDNRESPAPFARRAIAESQHAPLHVIGPGLREDVLFYLGRTVPITRSLDALPADYRGVAIVTADAIEPVRRSKRAHEIAESPDRSMKDRLYLVRFPRDP